MNLFQSTDQLITRMAISISVSPHLVLNDSFLVDNNGYRMRDSVHSTTCRPFISHTVGVDGFTSCIRQQWEFYFMLGSRTLQHIG